MIAMQIRAYDHAVSYTFYEIDLPEEGYAALDQARHNKLRPI